MAATQRRKSPAIKTNQAVSITGKDQEVALQNIAFGSGWEKFETDIQGRIEHFDENEPIKQSTNRALDLVRAMMFEKL